MDPARLTFNIIFLPGAVAQLKLFTPSLVAWTRDVKFRLVSNGCSSAEDDELEKLAQLSPRLDFLKLPYASHQHHGTALSWLQDRETGPYFAFLDSDIFAVGEFLPELLAELQQSAAVFSCPPLWSTPELETLPDDRQAISGVYNRCDDGFCLGGSYFAIYDNTLLAAIRADTGLDFLCRTWETISRPVREELSQAGHRRTLYDTGKLINILLGLRGHQCTFQLSPNLVHIGGVTGTVLLRRRWKGLRRKGWSAILPAVVRRILYFTGFYNGWRERVSQSERDWQDAKFQRRHLTSDTFRELLDHLASGNNGPVECQHPDPELQARVRRVEMLIRNLYPLWDDWLTGSQPLDSFIQKEPVTKNFPGTYRDAA